MPHTAPSCPDAADFAPGQAVAVITTIDDGEQARAMARALVERRLAACVQISTIGPWDVGWNSDGGVIP